PPPPPAAARRKLAVSPPPEEPRPLAPPPPRSRPPGTAGLGASFLLRLLTEREPEPLEMTRIEPREHVRLILPGIDRASEQRTASTLDDSRVVPRREARSTGAPREGEQLGE